MISFILLLCLLTGFGTSAGSSSEDPLSGDNLELIKQSLTERLSPAGGGVPLEAAGEAILAPDLLLLFYEKRNYRPAWIMHDGLSPQTQSLIEAIKRAPLDGLASSDYHLPKIEDLGRTVGKNLKKKRTQTDAAAAAADLELLCSDAFLSYGSHLSQGKVNAATSVVGWQGRCIDESLVEILEKSIVSGGIGVTLPSLLPPHPFYKNLKKALEHYRSLAEKTDWKPLAPASPLKKGDRGKEIRQLRDRLLILGDLKQEHRKPRDAYDDALEAALRSYQTRSGLEATGLLDPPTLTALNAPPLERIRQVEANLERWRWMPRDLGERFIYVNVADFKLEVFDDWRKVLAMKVVVGSDAWQTPDFSSQITHLIINPYWTIPIPVLLKETINYILQNPCYFRDNKMRILRGAGDEEVEVDPASINWSGLSEKNLNFRVRQEPGPDNILGRLKFVFPNEYEIFLHDTPYQEDFSKITRTFSHGCIRAEKPIDLAVYLLRGKARWDPQSIQTAIDAGVERTVRLVEPMNIYFLYCTAWQEDDGTIQLRPDVYDRDAGLIEALGQRPPLPLHPGEGSPAIRDGPKSSKVDDTKSPIYSLGGNMSLTYSVMKSLSLFLTLFIVSLMAIKLPAQESEVVKLPTPQMTGGRPLMDCLKARQSIREFGPDKISAQTLSNLLWAADGINRPDSGKRTAPSAVNWQDIDIYVATADGLFLYWPKEHALKKILGEDVRAAMGTQDFVKEVPINLIYVSDYAKLPRGDDENRRFYSGTHTGFISQNVYLFCASEGLATVVRGLIDRDSMAKVMQLRPEQHITFAQSVGYPKK